MTTTLEAAIAYARRGWPVFPCVGKEPITEHGFKDASTDEAVIQAWWKSRPDANVAIATGLVSGTYVLDVDDGGEASLVGKELPPTLEVRTGGGGRHIYFRRPEGAKWGNTTKRLPGIDTRGDGGYVLMPPSTHKSGTNYAWIKNGQKELAPAPAWLLDLCGPKKKAAPTPTPAPKRSGPPPTGYGETALAGECARVSGCTEGGRNHQLNESAFSLGTLVGALLLEEGTVRADLMAAALAAGLEEDEARKTIDSGLSAGMKNPRQVKDRTRAKAEITRARAEHAEEKEAAAPAKARDWRTKLLCTKDNTPKGTLGNALIFFENDERWAGVLAYNVHAAVSVFLKAPPWGPGLDRYPRPISDNDVVRAVEWMEGAYGTTAATTIVGVAMHAVADRHRFDPVRDYLDGLKWDGTARLETWVVRHFGAADTAFTRAASSSWMVSAVARIMEPGCKADHVLILEGEQGLRKSTGLEVLGGEWFSDELPDLGDKDAKIALCGVWILELAELDALRKADATKAKKFLAQKKDRFRPPYGKHMVEVPRRCVFAATTNEHEHLKDPTGGRRFWPIKCERRADLVPLAAERDQLWAEAVHLYRERGLWWLEGAVEVAATEEQALRLETDPWQEALEEWVEARAQTPGYVTTREGFIELGREKAERSKSDQMRLSNVFRAMGFMRGKHPERVAGAARTERRYRRPRAVSTSDDPGGGDIGGGKGGVGSDGVQTPGKLVSPPTPPSNGFSTPPGNPVMLPLPLSEGASLPSDPLIRGDSGDSGDSGHGPASEPSSPLSPPSEAGGDINDLVDQAGWGAMDGAE